MLNTLLLVIINFANIFLSRVDEMGCKSSKSKKNAHLRAVQYQKESAVNERKMKRSPECLDWGITPPGAISTFSLHNLLTDGFYSPFHKNPQYLLLVDCRSEMEYAKQTLVTAQWYQKLNEAPSPNSCYSIVLFDDATRTVQPSVKEKSPLSLLFHELKRQHLDPKFVMGGWPMIELICSHLIVNNFTKSNQIPWYPSLLIPDFLYLGQEDVATDLHILLKLNITHIVALTNIIPQRVHPSTNYLIVPLSDDYSSLNDRKNRSKKNTTNGPTTEPNLLSSMSTILAFVEEARTIGGSVLVYCDQGFTRSTVVSMAILMSKTQCTLEDAYYYVKEARSSIHPHQTLLSQLSNYEEMIFGTTLTDIEDLI